jgi:pimeloyl-ACP methyl ester carboxylesterase
MSDEELARIYVPTLFCWGQEDPFLSPQRARPSVAKIPGAQLHEVAGGHAHSFEDPVGCASLVDAHQRAARS